VVLVDQHAFPRDKVCGDGLIPDAHAALRRLGVLDEVMAQAQPVTHVRCVGPRGGRVDVPGTLAVLPRRELDDILLRAAVRAGCAAVHAGALRGPAGGAAGCGRRATARRRQPHELARAGWCWPPAPCRRA
jgi:flavin-dependent dehydrogenase